MGAADIVRRTVQALPELSPWTRNVIERALDLAEAERNLRDFRAGIEQADACTVQEDPELAGALAETRDIGRDMVRMKKRLKTLAFHAYVEAVNAPRCTPTPERKR